MNQEQLMKIKRAKYEFFDWFVLVAALMLAGLGVLMVFSITGTSIHNNASGDRLSYMMHSATGTIGGIMAMTFVALMPHKLLKHKTMGIGILAGTILLFVITHFFGHGTELSPTVSRWITIPGVITFQAVDLLRLGFTLSLPWTIHHLAEKKLYHTQNIVGFYLVPLAYILFATLMVVGQRDLGSAIIMFTTGVIVFFSSGLHVKQILVLLGIGISTLIVAATLGVYALNLDFYQTDRIQVWLDPFTHPNGNQIVMGFVSLALGGWTGVGIGNSTVALGFAIEPHTDLIITIVAEELGAVTVLIIMLLYFLIAYKCFKTAFKARETFSPLVCIAVGVFFLAQPFVNLGGVSGVIPLSGVALPLISYGMTNKLSTFVLVGLYFNMRRQILVDAARYETKKSEPKQQLSENVTDYKNVLQFPPKQA